jgi:hypothetical protein
VRGLAARLSNVGGNDKGTVDEAIDNEVADDKCESGEVTQHTHVERLKNHMYIIT